MKRVGDICNVRIIQQINDRTAEVVDEENNIAGILKIKGDLKVRKNGTVMVWILQVDSKRNKYTFGNSYFGKYSISESIVNQYVEALEKVLGYSANTLEPDDVSILKGMVNRCIKHDTWDWFTTYSFLGYPSYPELSRFVQDSVKLRKDILEGKNDSFSAFVSNYQYMLVSIYSHLSNNITFNDKQIEIPIKGFDKELWDKLLYDSKKNIILVEQMNKQISKYLLMHYFVTLEQEFQNNFILPFQQNFTKKLNSFGLNNVRWKITHELLCGNTHFSLGAVYYLWRCCRDSDAISASDAISSFVEFLGENKHYFVKICDLIIKKRICGYLLKDLRNGLAHGDSTITNAIDQSAFDKLHNFLFSPPEGVLREIIIHSMNV